MGIQLYGLSRWMCNDYISLYHSPQTVSKMQPILFSQSIQIRCLPRMHLVWQCSGMDEQVMLIVRVIFCPGLLIAFSEHNEIAIRRDDLNLTKYFANEGWKSVADQWLLLSQVFGYKEKRMVP